MASSNHYQTLQLPRTASQQDIKQAFRRLARQYHPDLNPNKAEAAEVFRRLREAYDVLSDPIQRRYYDQGKDPNDAQTASGPGTDGPGTEPSPGGPPANSAHRFYLQGINREVARDYYAAVEAYSEAISLDQDFHEAYLRRAQMRYALGQDRAVLEDCTQLIERQAHLAAAHYYQGLARFRLGYSQSAIEAFSLAVQQDPDHGQAFQQRAVAHLELGDRELAIADFHQALERFQTQGEGRRHGEVAAILQRLQGRPSNNGPNFPGRTDRYRLDLAWLKHGTRALPGLLLNPSANLLPLYGKLSPGQAGSLGLLWLGLTYGFGLIAAMLRWSADSQQVIWPMAIVVTLAIASFVAALGLLRIILGYVQGMAKVLFVAGAALLPLGLLCLAMSWRAPELWPVQLSLMAIACTISLLVLHSGLVQICDVPETLATLAVPMLFLLSGWLAYWTFNSLMPPPLELLETPNMI